MPTQIFIDFSSEAKDEFKISFRKNFEIYNNSAQVQYYSGRIASVLSGALTTLTAGLQSGKASSDLQYYLILTNALIVFLGSIIFGISTAIKVSKGRYVENIISQYPNNFHKRPTAEAEPFVESKDENHIDALKYNYLRP